MASAVLWVLSHPSDFDNGADDSYNLLQLEATNNASAAWSPANFELTLGHWVYNPNKPFMLKKLDVFFRLIYYFSTSHCYSSVKVGTKCDYDFVLVDLAHLLYTFRDGDTPLTDPKLNGVGGPPPPNGVAWTYADFLTNDMIYNIVCQNIKTDAGDFVRSCQPPYHVVPYAFRFLTNELTYRRLVDLADDGVGPGVIVAETENHVLNIITWDYLISNWVMWQGSLMGGNSRRNDAPYPGMTRPSMNDVALARGGRYKSHGVYVCDRVLNATGRVMHSGMYETNSRPYGRVFLSALLALANFGNPFPGDVPFTLPCTMDDVKQGASNAVDYLAAKFTFQSLRGKRQGPMRRGKEYRKKIDFYKNNSFATMMSLLSGSYEWRDCIQNKEDPVDGRPMCPILKWGPDAYARMSEYAAIASSWVGGYRIPDIIHEQMFTRGPFYARMKSRYTKDHYKLSSGWPEYFEGSSTTHAFHTGNDRSSFELYFGDDDILLSAGGSYTPYYVKNTNDVWAKPTMLIPRGDFGHYGDSGGSDPPWEWRNCDYRGAGTGDAHHHVALSPGRVWKWWASECNVWQYGSFVYGYLFHDVTRPSGAAKIASRSFSAKYPFYVPWDWGEVGRQGTAANVLRFTIDSAEFEIYEFSLSEDLRPPEAAAKHGPYSAGNGYFIVRARFRKDVAKKIAYYRKHREYARGFLEIIPRDAFIDAQQLQNTIVFWNTSFGDFSGGDKLDTWKYVRPMNQEKIHMGSQMGANSVGAEGCDDNPGITSIWKFTWPDTWDQSIDTTEFFIPSNIRDSAATKEFPLITVWELDDRYERTGCKLVETIKEGVIVVRQKGEEMCLEGNPAHCEVWGPGWNCYKMDSEDYLNPSTDTLIGEPDCHCFEP